MKHLLILSLVMMCGLNLAYGAENKAYQCVKGTDVRSLTVQYTGTDNAQSCSVLYQKSASEAAKELWHYQSHLDQCETKSQEFLKKLEGFGLACAAAK